MAHLVVQDHVQDGNGGQGIGCAHLAQFGLDLGRGIQPPGFERAGHQGHARQHIVPGLLAHGPQALVGRKVTIVVALAAQVIAQQPEVFGLFGRNAHPVQVVIARHAIKSPHGIQRQVDGVELDVGDGVDENGAALGGGGRAAGHLGVAQQLGALGAAGQGVWSGGGRRGGVCY